jgi:hypothetical protein
MVELLHKCTKEGLLLWIIGILLIAGAIIIFFPKVSAVYEIEKQGDIVFQGEYVDISRVMSWSGQFAWWASGNPTHVPDRIVDYNDQGFMHNYYIDPDKYVVGMWFKWDLEDEARGNMEAFEVRKGTRNETYPSFPGRATPVPTPTPGQPAKNIPKDTHVLIARGDNGLLKYGLDYNQSEGKEQSAYLWLFGTVDSKTKILGGPLTYHKNDSVYSYEFTPQMTEGLVEGWFIGYLQFTGPNGFQDVFYVPSHKFESDGEFHQTLDTPYDDKIIPDINLDPFIPIRISQEFEKLEKKSQYCDDILVPITMEVATPSINFREYYTSGNNITIQGDTTMAAGTMIVFMIDPQRWALPNDIKAHTWSTETTGSQNEPRTFSMDMPINWKEMSVGANHTVRATVEKNKIKVSQFKDFKVTDVYIVPTPTPERDRVLVEEYGWHVLNVTPTATPIPTEAPTITPTDTTTTNITTAQTTTITTAPTPTAVPTPKPTPTIKVPVETATILIAVGLGLWRMKR